MSEDPREAAYRDAAAAVDQFLGRLGEGGGPSTETAFRTKLARAMDLNVDLVRQAIDAAGDGLLDRPTSVTMPPVLAGSTSTTLLWVHNHGAAPRTGVGLEGGAIGPIPGSAWTFGPGSVTVPGESAAPVVAALAVPEATPPGTYEGIVSVGDAPLTVRIDVHDGEPIPHDRW